MDRVGVETTTLAQQQSLLRWFFIPYLKGGRCRIGSVQNPSGPLS